MSRQKSFIIEPQDLYDLLVHYTDGEIPLNGVIQQVGVNPYLQRMVGLYVESDEWETDTPLQIRYQGRRTATWTQGDEEMQWAERNDTPTHQG